MKADPAPLPPEWITTSDPRWTEAREVPGYPRYRVGRDGTFYSGIRAAEGLVRVKRLHLDKKGYWQVNIEGKTLRAHMFVALAWVGPRPSPLHETRHLDGNPQHNDASNLLWGTRKENAADRARHGTIIRGEQWPWARLSDEKVRQIRAEHDLGMGYRRLARKYGVCQARIRAVLSRKEWSHVA